MNNFRFLNFTIYKEAIKLRADFKSLLFKLDGIKEFALKDQLNRASISIVLNIAEGSTGYSDLNFRRFLKISMGSLYETVAILDICKNNKILTEDEFKDYISKCTLLGELIGAFMKKLKP